LILTKPELVSAIIPTHNRPDLVEKAVLSALHQTHTSMEVIVVIDGVDRATEEALARIHDTRLRIIALALNAGGSEARNIGIRAAEGKWVAFLDDDDEWLPHKITKQIEAAVASKLAFPVISSRMVVRTPLQDFTVPRRLFAADEAMSEYLFYRRDLTDGPFTLQTSTLFMRRETMLSILFALG
jgi:glycosyltransferase involved in cell wall biosynthesis